MDTAPDTPFGSLAFESPVGPLPGSYWVVGEVLAAGQAPRAHAPDGLVIDLTEPGRRRPATASFPIPDFGVPPPARMEMILDTIDGALSEGRRVFVHCLAGRGRTGVVVGCWLVRHGVGSRRALESIALLRAGAGLHGRSPETRRQVEYVESWSKGP